MDQKFIEEMKKRLEKEREEINDDLRGFAKENLEKKGDYKTEFPQYGDKDEDNAIEVATFQDNLSLENNLEAQLKEIEQALLDIKNNKYGICKKCNQEIDKERLSIYPAAPFCTKCKSL